MIATLGRTERSFLSTLACEEEVDHEGDARVRVRSRPQSRPVSGFEVEPLLERLGEPAPWKAKAACSGVVSETGSHDTFFPKGGTPKHVIYGTIERFCRNCPVRLECLLSDITSGYPDNGIFGGFVIRERQLLARHAKSCTDPSCTEFEGYCVLLRENGFTSGCGAKRFGA